MKDTFDIIAKKMVILVKRFRILNIRKKEIVRTRYLKILWGKSVRELVIYLYDKESKKSKIAYMLMILYENKLYIQENSSRYATSMPVFLLSAFGYDFAGQYEEEINQIIFYLNKTIIKNI